MYNNHKRKIVLFGAGRRCVYLLQVLLSYDYDLIAIFDNDKSKVGKRVCGIEVLSKSNLEAYCEYQWCITVAHNESAEVIRQELILKGFLACNEIAYNKLILESCKETLIVKSQCAPSCIKDDVRLFFGCLNGLILGGIEARTVILVNYFMEIGFNRAYIISDSKGYSIDIPEMLKGHIIKTRNGEANVSSLDIIQNCVDILIANLPCIVITNQPDYLLLAAYFVRCLYPGCLKIITTVSGLTDGILNNYFSYGTESDFYIGVSTDIEMALIKRGVCKENVGVIRAPFFCDKNLNRDYSKMNTPIVIGYAGRLEYEQKRMDLVVKLINSLAHYGISFVFNIAGEGGAESDMIESIDNKSQANRVVFHGYIKKKEMVEFWKKQDIVINMADYEGRSISVVEAMGAGVIPVVTDTSGVRDDIIDGVNGYIIPVGDYDEAVKRIIYLYNNRDVLPIMGMKAHDEVWPKGDITKCADEWIRIIERLIGDIKDGTV